MHVLQRIAVNADDKDEAFRRVKDTLEMYMGDGENNSAWYDWFVCGGGRWNANASDSYSDDDQSMTISYAEEPDKFIEAVNEGIAGRMQEFNSYRQSFASRNIDMNAYLDKYDGQMEFGMELYDLYKCIDLMQGKWDFNSYFYDMEHETINTKYMLDNLDENWYIIFVDFHF